MTPQALARKIDNILVLLMDADDDSGRLNDCNLSWDVGLALLDARTALSNAMGKLDIASLPARDEVAA